MEVGDIRFYRERWKAVEEIERQELRAMSLEERWQKLNAIIRFAREMPAKGAGEDEEEYGTALALGKNERSIMLTSSPIFSKGFAYDHCDSSHRIDQNLPGQKSSALMRRRWN
jgi:hypothetical protein